MIETPRLILRPQEPQDLAWQLAALNTPAVMRFLGGAPRPPEAFAAGFERNARAWQTGEPAFFTVILRETDELIGKCGLSRISESLAPDSIRGAIQAGWTLAEPFWGKGYALEAARAMVAHGFATFGVPELWAQTSDSNAASTALMVRLGMERRPDLFYRDPDYPPADNPTTVYRIGREEWAAQE